MNLPVGKDLSSRPAPLCLSCAFAESCGAATRQFKFRIYPGSHVGVSTAH